MIHVVGHTAIDHISKVPHLPKPNCSTHITDRQVYFGGGASNIAAGIAMLGERVTLHSCIGGDFSGSEYDHWMARLGICREFFLVPDAHTPTAFMFTEESGAQMTFFEWGASRAFASAEAPALPLVLYGHSMGGAVAVLGLCGVVFPQFDPGVGILAIFWQVTQGRAVGLYRENSARGEIDTYTDDVFRSHTGLAKHCRDRVLKSANVVSWILQRPIRVQVDILAGDGQFFVDDAVLVRVDRRGHLPPGGYFD